MANDLEESRTASLGRKRRNDQDVVPRAPPADKRRKVEDNADFIALDSSSDSDDAPAHARSQKDPITISSDEDDGKESGELSDSATRSRRSSRASAPSASTSVHGAAPKARQPPQKPVDAVSDDIDVDLVFPDNLRKHVRYEMKMPSRPSAAQILHNLVAMKQLYCKQAQTFLACWREGYRKHLEKYRFSELQDMVHDTDAFDQDLSTEWPPKGKAKPSKAAKAFRSAFEDASGRGDEQSNAAAMLQLIRMPQCHVEACRLLRRYIDNHRKTQREGEEDSVQDGEDDTVEEGEDAIDGQPVAETFADGLTSVSELSPEDQTLQYRYFRLSGEDQIRCLSCGTAGHTKASCPANKCTHCTSTKHFSRLCPLINKSDSFKTSEPPCSLCNDMWHADEWCPDVWTTFKPSRDAVRKVPPEHMSVTCYNCGGNGGKGKPHWGDDCPDQPKFLAEMITFDTWSSKNANRYIVNDGDSSMDEGEVEDDGRMNGGGSVQAYQRAQLAAWY